MGAFAALAGFLAPRLHRWRWAVLAAWVAILVVAGASTGGLSGLIKEDYGARDSTSWRANAILKEKFAFNSVTELVLIFEHPPGSPDAADAAFRARAAEAAKAVPAVTATRVIPTPGDKPDLALTHLTLDAALDDRGSVSAVKAIKEKLAAVAAPPGQKVHLMGRPVVMEELTALNNREVARVERVSLFISLGVLILVFGSLVAAVLPVLIGLAGIITTLGVLSLLGGLVPVVELTRLVTSIIGVAIGIDYALFMVSRYREERAHGLDSPRALEAMLAHTGEAIAFSGAIMAVSVASLFIPDFSSTRAIAGTIVLVVATTLVASYTLLPALLAVLDGHLDKPRWLSRWRIGFGEAFWAGFAHAVVKRYRPILVLSLLFVGLLVAQVGHLKLWEPSPSLLPPELSSRQGYDALERAGLAGEVDAFYLVVHQPPGDRTLAPATIAAMDAAQNRLEADPRVLRVDGLLSLREGWALADYQRFYAQLDNPLLGPALKRRLDVGLRQDEGGTYSLMRIVPTLGLSSPELRHLVLDLERQVMPTFDRPGGLTFDLGGNVPRRVDFSEEIYSKTGWVIAVTILSVYGLLLVYFRSLLLPLKAVAMNALPVLGGLAVLVLVMQDGLGAGLIGIADPPGALMAMTPLMIFCVVFGLGMDYEVLILSRVREAHLRGLADAEAIAEGMAKTSGIVTGAALIMLSVFVPNIFSAVLNAKELGLGLTAAVLLDATVVRLLLVPTLMRGMGKWNWYFPGRRAPAPLEQPEARAQV